MPSLAHLPIISEHTPKSKSEKDEADVLVIGSVAMDTSARTHKEPAMNDSNPGTVSSSVGGVGFNINLACELGLQAAHASKAGSNPHGDTQSRKQTRLVSTIGDDFAGQSILEQIRAQNMDSDGLLIQQGASTAQYSSIHGSDGSLVVACADMAIVEGDISRHIQAEIERASPRWVVLDCNLSQSVLGRAVAKSAQKQIKVVIDPTSGPKSRRLAEIECGVYPHNCISLVTPTTTELSEIYSSFERRGRFSEQDRWFSMLDSLGINREFRDRCEAQLRRPGCEILEKLYCEGTMQQCFKMLPFFPNILVKLGADGVLLVSITRSADSFRSIPTVSPFCPRFTVTSHGKMLESGEEMGVLVQYFPCPNSGISVTNVTGAGDTFLGCLVLRLVVQDGTWLDNKVESVEQEWGKWEDIHHAQVAAGLSIQSERSVSLEIKRLYSL